MSLLPSSPPSPFILPSYAEDAATIMSAIASPPQKLKQPKYHSSVFQFLDVKAREDFGGDGSLDDQE